MDFAKEAQTPMPELPDPFLREDGSRVATPAEWPRQRAWLKEMLAHFLYGHMPASREAFTGAAAASHPAYEGRAVRETLLFSHRTVPALRFHAQVVRPADQGPCPVILWNRGRGEEASPLEEELVCVRGCALVMFQREELAPDGPAACTGPLAQAYPACDWGAVAMWAWGCSLVADYLAGTHWADMKKLAVTGHSRGAKAAVCAAVYDERFSVCAAAGSGCGGLGCLRFVGSRYGENIGLCETVGNAVDGFPFWWSDHWGAFGARITDETRTRCGQYGREIFAKIFAESVGRRKDEALLPFDLHFLRALIAPRAVISLDGLGDTWSNPFGTQITWRAAQEVFDFLQAPHHNALFFREGGHEFSVEDWRALTGFCGAVFSGRPVPRPIVAFPRQGEAPPETPLEQRERQKDWKQLRLHYRWRRP